LQKLLPQMADMAKRPLKFGILKIQAETILEVEKLLYISNSLTDLIWRTTAI